MDYTLTREVDSDVMEKNAYAGACRCVLEMWVDVTTFECQTWNSSRCWLEMLLTCI